MSADGALVLAPLAAPSQQSVASGGVPVTPGKGPLIATDAAGGIEYQVVKLGLGAMGAVSLLEFGPKPAEESVPVVLPAGQIVVATPPRPASSTCVAVAASETNVTLLAANAGRLGATIYNNSTSIMYVKLGADVSVSWTLVLISGAYYEVPYSYTGIIDGSWQTAGSGNCYVTELT